MYIVHEHSVSARMGSERRHWTYGLQLSTLANGAFGSLQSFGYFLFVEGGGLGRRPFSLYRFLPSYFSRFYVINPKLYLIKGTKRSAGILGIDIVPLGI